ncbi:MAG: T9SS type A sorting domain-containing protein [Bacteroidia bacterium]|nr:T9SS type A sorting domain-containing protein [Bacteroidia bacterium]
MAMKIKSSLLIALLLLNLQTALAQWKWLHPAPQGNHISQLSFISNATGWAAGEKGALIKTTNGGSSWTAQYAGIVNDISGMQFPDSLHGFIASESEFLVSSNSGQSWSIRYRFPSNFISALFMLDADTGFAGLSNGSGIGQLYKTTNGGSTWTSVLNNAAGDILDLYMKPSGVGVLSGTSGLLMRTTDFGATWTPVTIGTSMDLHDVSMPTNNHVYVAGDTELYQSTDGGQSFSPIGNPGSGAGAGLLSIDFGNSTNGVAGCTGGNIFYTTNAGSSWNQYVSNAWFDARAVFANNGLNFFVGGSNGGLLKTGNSGSTWLDLSSRVAEFRLNAIDAVTTSTAYAAGASGVILQTSNNGNTWTAQTSNAGGEDLNDLFFINPSTGLAVGSNGTMVKTSDGGINWNFVFSGIGESMYGLARAANNKLYVCGANGKLAFSNDNGDTWTDLPTSFTGLGYAFTEVQCFGNDTLVISTDQPYLVSTYDNGLSWNLLNNGSSFECSAMYFRNAMYGWIGTTVGEVYATTDGGNTWTLAYQTQSNAPVGAIRFSDPLNGWFFSGNEIFRTADGGGVWGREINPNQEPIYDIDFLNGNNALAVGDGLATILARNNDLQLSLPTQIFCTDNSYTLAINAIGNWNPGNQFRIELSDEFGEFIFPTTLGFVTATGTTAVPINVPNGLIDGTDYRIRIFSTNPPMWSSLNSVPLEIRTSPEAYIAAGGPTAFCLGGSVTLYAFTGPGWVYQWYKDGVLLSGATADTLYVTQSGDYTVNVSDGVCSLTSPITDVLVINCSGISENGNELFYRIFPNPATENITLSNPFKHAITQLRITDLTGRLILTESDISSSTIQVQTRHLAKGIYHLEIRGDKPAVLRFVKR